MFRCRRWWGSGSLPKSFWLAIGFALLASGPARAQGLLVVVDPDQVVRLPRPIIIYPSHPPHPPLPVPSPPPASYKIKELTVQARLQDQVAKVQVSQSFVNTGSQQMEVCFVFPLPYDGAIDQLTLLVDGKEFPAKLLPAAQARAQYEAIVRKNRDPALLEWVGTGMFQTSVFPVPPGAERRITLNYSQLLRKDRTLTDFLFPLSTAKYTSHPVEKLEFRIHIESTTDIKNVYSPTHSVEIQRPDARHAQVTFTRTQEIPATDFRLFFDAAPGEVGASLLSYRPRADEDGFFLLLASPQVKTADAPRLPKTVVFVLDRSGSMSGKKIEQAREALKFVLNNLREGDLFNIVTYDGAVESFRPELERYTEATRTAALGYINGIYAGGATNIDGALKTALSQLKDNSRPNYVIFLTDGLPTAGETAEAKIVANSQGANQVKARLISLGVGYDVNSRLLDRLANLHRGTSDYVRPDENIEQSVSRLYNRISSPVMTDVTLKFEFDGLKPEEGEPINRQLPPQVLDLFEGEQLVVAGRYRKAGRVKVTLEGKLAGMPQKFDFPVDLTEKSADESYAFVEKLWAIRRVGEILDQLDLNGKNEELVKELVELSTKHGILTPYTSFLADENANPTALSANLRQASDRLEVLREAEGRRGVAQRAAKQDFKRAENAAQSAGRPAQADGASKGLAGGATSAPAAAPGAAVFRDLEDREVVANNVRQVNQRTFYQRASDKTWRDASVSEAMEKKARRVVAFSDEYFKLVDEHGKRLSQYLVFDDPVLVNLEGEAFLFEPEGAAKE